MKLPFRAHNPKPRTGAKAGAPPTKSPPEAPTPPPRGARTPEIGGREGPDPTRYGDWEVKGRCIDF